jgi:PAT family beta-lactamase induction signal transducer AmpG
MRKKNLLSTTRGRFVAFGTLYISEGIPYGFTTTAMVAFMRTEGVSLAQIGAFVAALFVPWSFKWVWAPLIDLVKLPRFGGRKAWILFCLSMMIMTLVVTAIVDFHTNFQLLLAMIVLNNFFCATQDVAIDSLAVSTLRESERGRGNGFMFGGQYFGIALGGGGAVYVFGLWGFNAALMYVSGLMFLSWLFVLFFIRDPDVSHGPVRRSVSILSKLGTELKAFLRELHTSFVHSGRGPKMGLLFAVLPAGAMSLAYAMLSTIQVDYGLGQMQIARISVYNTIAGAVGCIIGGWLGDRYGVRRILAIFVVLTALPTVLLANEIRLVGLTDVPLATLYGAIIGHGFIFGMMFGPRIATFGNDQPGRWRHSVHCLYGDVRSGDQLRELLARPACRGSRLRAYALPRRTIHARVARRDPVPQGPGTGSGTSAGLIRPSWFRVRPAVRAKPRRSG